LHFPPDPAPHGPATSGVCAAALSQPGAPFRQSKVSLSSNGVASGAGSFFPAEARFSFSPSAAVASRQTSRANRWMILLAACRAFNVRCVVWLSEWMHGAVRSQWLFHWQVSQRSRRRPDAQSEGPKAVLEHGRLRTHDFSLITVGLPGVCHPPKATLAHS